jgi:hypothetical protein
MLQQAAANQPQSVGERDSDSSSIWSSGREKKGEEELIIKREKCPNNVPKARKGG